MAQPGMTDIWSFEAQNPAPPPTVDYVPRHPKEKPVVETGGGVGVAPWEDKPLGGTPLPEWQPPYEQPPDPATVPGGFFSGAGTGFSSAAKSAVGSKGWAGIVLNDAVGGDPNNIPGKISQAISTVGSDDKLAVGDYRKVNDWNTLKTYLGEGVGQMGGSIAGYLAAMGIGAGAGAAVAGPGGAAVGGLTGAAANAILDGIGQMGEAMLEDPQLKEAVLKDPSLRQKLASRAIVFGGAMGALDTAALAKLSKMTGIGEKLIFGHVTNAVKNSVKRRLLEGAVVEGGTEGLQQTIQEITRTLSGGKEDWDESKAQILNATLYGIIGGAPVAALPGGGGNKGAVTTQGPPVLAPAPAQPAMAPAPTGTPPGQGPAPPPPGTGSVPPPVQGPPPGAPGSGAYRPGSGAPPRGQYRGPTSPIPPMGSPPPPDPNPPGTPPPPPQQPPGPGATSPSTPGGYGQPQGAPPGAQTANTTTAFTKPDTAAEATDLSDDTTVQSIFARMTPMLRRAAGEAPIDTAAPISTATSVSMPGDDLALAMRHATQPVTSATGEQAQPGPAPAMPAGPVPGEAPLGPSTASPGPQLGPSLQQSDVPPSPPLGPTAATPGPALPGEAQVPTPATPLEPEAPAALPTDAQLEPAPPPVAPLPAAEAVPPLKKGKAKAAEIKAKKAKPIKGVAAKPVDRGAQLREKLAQLKGEKPPVKKGKAKVQEIKAKAKAKPKVKAKPTTEPRIGKPYTPPPKAAQRPALVQEAKTLPEAKGLPLTKEGKEIKRPYLFGRARREGEEPKVKPGTKRAEGPPRTYEPEVGKAKGVVYVQHGGDIFAVPAGSWRQAMVRSFTKGSFQGASLLTPERVIEGAPEGAHVANPGDMVRQDFKAEAQRVFREQRGRHKQPLYEHKETPRPPRREGPETEERKRRTAPAYSLISGEVGPAQKRPERVHGDVKPVVPVFPESTGRTGERGLQAEVQSRGRIFVEAMKALSHHDNYGERMQAVQQTVAEFVDRMIKSAQTPQQEAISATRDTSNDPTAPLWQRTEVGRAAMQNLEAILRQQRYEGQKAAEKTHKTSVAIRHAREQADLRANPKLMEAGSHIWGEPIRKDTPRNLTRRVNQVLARLGKDAPTMVHKLAELITAREKVKDAKRGTPLVQKLALDSRIKTWQNLWADYHDQDMQEYLAKLEKEGAPVPEPVSKEESEEQRAANRRQAMLKKTAERNRKAKAVVDSHMTPETIKSDRYGWNWDKITTAIKNAYETAIGAGIKIDDVSPENHPPYENWLAHVRRLMLNDKGNVKRILGATKRLDMMTEALQSLAEVRSDTDGTNFNEWIKYSTPTREEGPGKRSIEDEGDTLEGAPARRKTPAPPPTGSPAPGEGPYLHNSETGYTYRLGQKLSSFDNVMDHLRKRGFDIKGSWARKSDLYGLVDKAIVASLEKLVPDVRVVKLPGAEIKKLLGYDAHGYFQPPTAEERIQGERGTILIDDSLDPDTHRRIIMHEAIHAAAHWAYRNNYNGTRAIIDELWREAKKQAEAKGLPTPKEGLWENGEEFLTWAMSDPEAQEVLQGMHLVEGSGLETRVRQLKTGKFFPDMWRSLVASVANFLGMTRYGRNGMNYVEAMMRVYGATAQDRQTSTVEGVKALMAGEKRGRRKLIELSEADPSLRRSDGDGDTIFGANAIWQGAIDTGLAINQGIDSTKQFDRLRGVRDHWVTTTMGLMRRAEAMGMGPGHPLYEAGRQLLMKGPTRDELRGPGMKVAGALEQLSRSPKFAAAADEAIAIMDEASRNNVDQRYDLNHPKNAWMRNGDANLRHRLALDRLHARYNALDQEVKNVVDEIGQEYPRMQRDAAREQVLSILRATQQDFTAYGTTIKDVADWVMDGGFDRIDTPFQRPSDKLMARTVPDYAVKKVIEALDVNRMQGFYVPQTRRGERVIRASRDYSTAKWLPKGAAAIDEDTFEFRTTAEYEAYIKANDAKPAEKQDHIKTVREKPPPKGSTADPTYTVNVQNQHFSMWQNATEAEREREAMIASGEWDTVTPVQHARGGIEKNTEMLPRHIQLAIKAMEDLGLKGGHLDTAKAALIQAQVQAMRGNRMAHHNRIQRQNVFGARAGEATMAMRDYTFGYSNLVAGFRHNPEIEKNLFLAENELRTPAGQMDPNIKRKQELVRELRRRQAALDGYNHMPVIQNITTLTYASQLLSVSHVVLQMLQTVTSTWPHLAGQFGAAKATRLIYRAMRDIGVPDLMGATWSDLGVAIGDIGRALRGELPELQITHANAIKARLSGSDLRAFEAAVKIGALDDTAGQELDLSRLGKTRLENTNNAIANVVLSLTAGIEAMNRSAVLLAAKRGYMEKGMSEEAAIERALHDLEQTQGMYAAANNPTPMQHPAGRLLFQFKKFAVFTGNWIAKMIYHGFGGMKNLATGQRMTQEQKVQLRTIAWTLFAMGAMSGGSGALPWEVVGLPLMLIQAMLGKKATDPSDWMQEKTQQIAQYMGADAAGSRKWAELIMHGLPRLLNLDLSDRVGFQNLVSFGQPKSADKEAMFGWLGQVVGGPFLGRSLDIPAYMGSEKNWAQFPFMPKIVKDIGKAYEMANEGTFTKYNRRALEPYDPWETILKGAGFSTGEEKRQWEPGGAARMKSEEREKTTGRSDLMGRWYRADRLGDIAARERVWKEIQDWNPGQAREIRIDRGDLYRLRQKRLLDEKREHKKYGEAAYG